MSTLRVVAAGGDCGRRPVTRSLINRLRLPDSQCRHSGLPRHQLGAGRQSKTLDAWAKVQKSTAARTCSPAITSKTADHPHLFPEGRLVSARCDWKVVLQPNFFRKTFFDKR